MKEFNLVRPQSELPQDVGLHVGRGGGRQSDRCRIAQPLANLDQPRIIRAKIVAPFADAMGFIDRQKSHVALSDDFEKLRLPKPFRRDVQQPVPALGDFGVPPLTLFARERRVDERRFDSSGSQRIHLVFHQRDQRRQHQRDSAPRQLLIVVRQQRGDLIAQRFSRTCRHDDQRVAAAENPVDDCGLRSAKGLEAKELVQCVNRFHHRRCDAFRSAMQVAETIKN